MVREIKFCLYCGSNNVEFKETYYDLPIVGKALLYSIFCNNCGFKKSDIILLEVKEPVRYRFVIENKSDLYTKIVRSNTGKIIFEEVGIEINPGIAAEIFITNLEGLILKVLDILDMARRFKLEEEDLEAVKNANQIKQYLLDVLNGKKKLTIILEDIFGNSAILSEKAQRESI